MLFILNTKIMIYKFLNYLEISSVTGNKKAAIRTDDRFL